MVQLEDLKEVLGIDLTNNSEDRYLLNLIRRATFRLSSSCNRHLEYKENTEYYHVVEGNKLFLNNWPVWEILQLQEFIAGKNVFVDIVNRPDDTVANSICIYEGKKSGLIQILKNYSFTYGESCIRVKYKAGYKNILGTGKITGYELTKSVEGTKTLFHDEIRSGDNIVVGNNQYEISEIEGDTSLKLTTNIDGTFEAVNYRINNVPGDLADAVLMLSAASFIIRKYEGYGMDQKTVNFLSVEEDQILDIIHDSRIAQQVNMKFKDFDLGSVIDTYRRWNL